MVNQRDNEWSEYAGPRVVKGEAAVQLPKSMVAVRESEDGTPLGRIVPTGPVPDSLAGEMVPGWKPSKRIGEVMNLPEVGSKFKHMGNRQTVTVLKLGQGRVSGGLWMDGVFYQEDSTGEWKWRCIRSWNLTMTPA